MTEFRYRLSLEVVDHGERSFSAQATADCQDRLARDLAFDISRMFGCLNVPPSDAELVRVLQPPGGYISPLQFLALLESFWDGTQALEKALSLVVDVNQLISDEASDEEEQRRLVRFYIQDLDWVTASEDIARQLPPAKAGGL